MDPKLKVFLELIHSIIKSGGKGYGDEKFGLVMQPNGLCSIRSAPLMDQYKAVKDFLNNQRNRQRMQHTRTRDMHKEFLQSEVYLRHLDCFPGKTIGLTLFKRAKCNCLKWDTLRKCADTIEVQKTCTADSDLNTSIESGTLR